MKKYSADVHGDWENYADIGEPVYLAPEVDHRVRELRSALRLVLGHVTTADTLTDWYADCEKVLARSKDVAR